MRLALAEAPVRHPRAHRYIAHLAPVVRWSSAPATMPRLAVSQAISEVLHAASKLFGDTGDFTSCYLNEGKTLKAWGRQNQCGQKALWKAFKSPRMNWHVERASVLLQNAETCLPFLNQLRVCTKRPNKLVLKVLGGLSCKFTMAALAARTVFFLEIINPMRFVLNSLCKLADVHKVLMLWWRL
jgi:hypothetical protein